MSIPSFFTGLRRQCASSEDRLGSVSKVLTLQPLRFPLQFTGPIAILAADFRPEKHTREFHPADIAGIQQFAPEAMVAPLDVALSLADQKLRGRLPLLNLRFALVVLTSLDDTPLAAHHRDLLWRAFTVPVFEQLRDATGMVVARECEVHDGLHLDLGPGLALLQATHKIDIEYCECGAETPRLKRLSRAPAMAIARSA